MSTNQSYFMNYGTMAIDVKFNVAGGAGAIVPITKPDLTTKTCVGDGVVVTRTGVGTYTVVIKGTSAVRLVEDFGFIVGFQGAAAPAGALDARVTTITQATNDDITINLTTVATTGGAAADLTSTTTVVLQGAIRIIRVDGVI